MHREERLREADEIIFLNYPRITCMIRVLKRYRDFRGNTRDSVADGCIERMNWEFAWWVLYKGRTKARKSAFHDIAHRYPHKTAVIKNDHELECYLQTRIRKHKGELKQ